MKKGMANGESERNERSESASARKIKREARTENRISKVVKMEVGLQGRV